MQKRSFVKNQIFIFNLVDVTIIIVKTLGGLRAFVSKNNAKSQKINIHYDYCLFVFLVGFFY